jgi:class 3 adenylate cyclase
MPRFPIFRLGKEPARPELPELIAAAPSIALEGLAVGVDNLRHDVVLSPRFVEAARAQVMRLIVRHGELEGLLAAEAPQKTQGPSWMRNAVAGATRTPTEKSDWKPLLAELHLAALNRAKREENISVDLLARLAVTKFLRTEMHQQFAQVLERCRVLLKNYEGIRQGKAVEYRERVAAFQVRKKIILRKTGQDLFETLREIEKETLARMRRSLFGEAKTGEAKTGEAAVAEKKPGEAGSAGLASYGLFLNRLAFSEDGRDDYLCAEHYVMLGNWDRDPDRYPHLQDVVWGFVRSLFGEETTAETIDGWLCAPENAPALVGTGTPDDSTPEGVAQQQRLAKWVRLLEDEQVMECVIASYYTVPLLSQYAPRINPQQLKNALISRPECDRVERMIQEHGKLSPSSLYAAVGKVAGCRGAERAKVAARFLQDFSQYHRDLRRLETLNAALDSVNVVSTEKLRELSRMNGTLYEFLLPEEQQPEEDRVLRHVVLKADVRDSTRLTRTLMEKGLNPASYFSLNFYDPVNKLLAKYGAQKVFLEGDAIILAILERTGEPELAVSRACVLAREIIEIVRGYNELMQRSGMPELELGVGITLQEAAPLYLMDGEHQIMISEALNESDRLSSCNKRARKVMEPQAGPFHVFVFQAGAEPSKAGEVPKAGDAPKDEAENPEDLISYNLGGIRMNEAAFRKLEQEITLVPLAVKLPPSIAASDKGEYHLFSATVPVDRDIYRKIVVRQSRVPRILLRDFSVQGWTERTYYEVCTDPAIYAALEKKKGASR